MGFVANDEDLQLRQLSSEGLGYFIIPATPANSPADTMNDPGGDHIDTEDAANTLESTNTEPKHHKPADLHTEADEDYSAENEGDAADENPYADLDSNTTLAIPVTNPSAFPVERLREVQEGCQPSTHIINMLVHKTPPGPINQVTADIQDGSVNHLIIRDTRIIDALGFSAPDFDTINLDTAKLRLDETFEISILLGQKSKNMENWIMGELVSGRHAYLYWLDERQSANPRAPPFAAEAKAIARKIGRRWPDVMKEIEGVWKLEDDRGGREYRENRIKYLGEAPTYPEGAQGRRKVRSMFG